MNDLAAAPAVEIKRSVERYVATRTGSGAACTHSICSVVLLPWPIPSEAPLAKALRPFQRRPDIFMAG